MKNNGMQEGKSNQYLNMEFQFVGVINDCTTRFLKRTRLTLEHAMHMKFGYENDGRLRWESDEDAEAVDFGSC